MNYHSLFEYNNFSGKGGVDAQKEYPLTLLKDNVEYLQLEEIRCELL